VTERGVAAFLGGPAAIALTDGGSSGSRRATPPRSSLRLPPDSSATHRRHVPRAAGARLRRLVHPDGRPPREPPAAPRAPGAARLVAHTRGCPTPRRWRTPSSGANRPTCWSARSSRQPRPGVVVRLEKFARARRACRPARGAAHRRRVALRCAGAATCGRCGRGRTRRSAPRARLDERAAGARLARQRVRPVVAGGGDGRRGQVGAGVEVVGATRQVTWRATRVRISTTGAVIRSAKATHPNRSRSRAPPTTWCSSLMLKATEIGPGRRRRRHQVTLGEADQRQERATQQATPCSIGSP